MPTSRKFTQAMLSFIVILSLTLPLTRTQPVAAQSEDGIRRQVNSESGKVNFIGPEVLYGRYWGALLDKPFLHFELCYYQAIDAAIERGLERVEAGAQGGHKRPEPQQAG